MIKRQQVKPSEIDFRSIGRRDYNVCIEHSTIWGHHLIPLTVIVGGQAVNGEGLVVIGSTHGNEFEGPIGIKNLMGKVNTNKVCGRIIFIPVLNVPGFFAGKRDSPEDGLNLNREFPGKPQGSITQRLADFVNRFIFPEVHAVFDIHSGGLVSRFDPLSSFHYVENSHQRKTMEVLARGFGCKLTMRYQNNTPGLLTSTAEKLGKLTIGTELGFGEAVLASGVGKCQQGILFGAIYLKQMLGPLPENKFVPANQQVLSDTSDTECSFLAPYPGHFEPCVEVASLVKKGDLLAYLHDFYRIDEPPLEILAPHAGYVVSQAWNAKVVQGQVILQVGKSQLWEQEFNYI
jgi:predicted deacylase